MSIRALLLSALLAVSPIVVSAADRAEIEQKVAHLDEESMKLLGVSLNALQYLVNASPNHYLSVWDLENSGAIRYVRELEAKGYVSIEIGLPDGIEPNNKFLRIVPVGAGIDVQQCVIALGKGK
ncbi:MAG: hypothetical protein WA190_00170 [Usitatibacter sp.]